MNETRRVKSKTKKSKLSPKSNPKTVDDRLCLTMIVKNESKIIKRCLDSLKEHIDYWVIVDTGSTDGTQEMIKKHLENIPGELHESKFISFGHNRTESLNLSKGKGKYILLMDADYEFKVMEKDFKKYITKQNAEGYLLTEGGGLNKDGSYKGFNYRNKIILRNDLDWVFRGSPHEVADLKGDRDPLCEIYDGAWIHNRYDGGSKSEKYTRDIKLLRKDLQDDPNNDRAMFYLGESYIHLAEQKGINEGQECVELLKNAIECYKKRSEMKNTWSQEVYFSLFKMARAKTFLAGEIDVLGYLRAYDYKPSRLEPIHQVLRHCRENKLYNIGYIIGKAVLENKKDLESEALFVDGDVYLYQMLDEFSICASWSGHNKEAITVIEGIIPKIEGDIEKETEDRIKENLKICRELDSKSV